MESEGDGVVEILQLYFIVLVWFIVNDFVKDANWSFLAKLDYSFAPGVKYLHNSYTHLHTR